MLYLTRPLPKERERERENLKELFDCFPSPLYFHMFSPLFFEKKNFPSLVIIINRESNVKKEKRKRKRNDGASSLKEN